MIGVIPLVVLDRQASILDVVLRYKRLHGMPEVELRSAAVWRPDRAHLVSFTWYPGRFADRVCCLEVENWFLCLQVLSVYDSILTTAQQYIWHSRVPIQISGLIQMRRVAVQLVAGVSPVPRLNRSVCHCHGENVLVVWAELQMLNFELPVREIYLTLPCVRVPEYDLLV